MSESMDNKDIEKEPVEETPTKAKSKRGTSMLFPVILIGAGVLLLLAALDILPGLNWTAVLRLWPLLLIFIGLDIIIRLVPRPLGTILSLILALAAVGLIVGVLLFADDIPIISEITGDSVKEVTNEQISYSAEGVETADIFLNLGAQSTTLSSLEDSDNLIEADVSYAGDLVFETSTANGQATVVLDTKATSDWQYWFNPTHWFDSEEMRRWQIDLAEDIPLNLDLELGSGSARLEFEGLTLSALTVEGGSGHVDMTLPGGDYDMFYDSGSGSVTIILPNNGRHQFLVESGSGSVGFVLPETMEAVIIVEDKGSGGLRIDKALFTLIEGDDDGEGVWVTSGYEDARNRLELILDTGSGSVSITSEN